MHIRLKEIKKRRALRGKQRVEHLMNSIGKRTVVVLNLSFFYFFNPFFVMRHAWVTVPTQTFGILICFTLVQDK